MFGKGEIVEVFEDPMTMTRKEGSARIVEHVEVIIPGLDLYRVNFIGDDPRTIVERQVAEVAMCCCRVVEGDNYQCRVHGSNVNAHWVRGVSNQ